MTTETIDVDGGQLHARVWGSGAPRVLALHGLTASHLSWAAVASAFDGTLVAPDLRGRGASSTLPGPYGMAQHADDAVALLDHLGVAEPITVAGHSMGGFVALVLAHRHPSRVGRIVLVDGGVPLPVPPGIRVDQLMAAIVGPAVARLEMTFASREEYHDWWRAHPAITEWTSVVADYVDYDLVGSPPELRSRTSAEAVRADSEDTLSGDALSTAWAELKHDAVFLGAERGMQNEPTPLYRDTAPIADRMPVHTVPDTNHYTITLGAGAATVASYLR